MALVSATLVLMPPGITTAQTERPIASFGSQSGRPVPRETLDTYPSTLDRADGEGLRAVQIDLNGDGRPEFIRVHGPSACGTGGCPYDIFDGRTRRLVGHLFGDPVWVFPTRVNGWSTLTVYSHLSATSGSYSSMVFDGERYVTVSAVMLYDRSANELFQRYRSVPEVKQ